VSEKKEDEVGLIGGTMPEQIAKWKDLWGNKVKLASLPLDDDGKEYLDVIVKAPDRNAMNEFEKWIDKNPGKAKEILVNACLLTRKDEVKASDDLFAGAFDAIANLIPIRKAIIKNL
jgi:hypothetical protein